MRNGVVNMQYVKLLELDQVYHYVGQRQIVWRILKKRIAAQINFMKRDVCPECVEPCRARIAQDMELMPFVCEPFCKFRCNNTATAKGWIANNSNVHKCNFYPVKFLL